MNFPDPSSDARILLQANGLRRSFGGVHAVRNISLSIPEKQIFALIGPNGAGKSTMLSLLSGAYQPNAGHISFNGRDMVGLPAHRRVRLGIARTFQSIRLFKQLSVLENVLAGFHTHHRMPFWQYALPGAARRADEARCHAEAEQLLSMVGLASVAERRAGTLSYGQQRMLEIARAMATKPILFMLDEPAAGLNSAEAEFLRELLVRMKLSGMAVVIVEHNMDLVMSVADHVFVMDHGDYLFQGTPDEVQGSPKVISAYLGAEIA